MHRLGASLKENLIRLNITPQQIFFVTWGIMSRIDSWRGQINRQYSIALVTTLREPTLSTARCSASIYDFLRRPVSYLGNQMFPQYASLTAAPS